MSFVDNGSADGSPGAGVDFHGTHFPLPHLVEHHRNLGDICDSSANIAMDRWIGVEQRRACEDSWRPLGMGFRRTCDQRRGHDLVSRAANRGDSRGEVKW